MTVTATDDDFTGSVTFGIVTMASTSAVYHVKRGVDDTIRIQGDDDCLADPGNTTTNGTQLVPEDC